MTEDFVRFSTQAMKDNRFSEGDPAKGETLGMMTEKRMRDQVDIFTRIKALDAPLPLEAFVSFDYLPADLARRVR